MIEGARRFVRHRKRWAGIPPLDAGRATKVYPPAPCGSRAIGYGKCTDERSVLLAGSYCFAGKTNGSVASSDRSNQRDGKYLLFFTNTGTVIPYAYYFHVILYSSIHFYHISVTHLSVFSICSYGYKYFKRRVAHPSPVGLCCCCLPLPRWSPSNNTLLNTLARRLARERMFTRER